MAHILSLSNSFPLVSFHLFPSLLRHFLSCIRILLCPSIQSEAAHVEWNRGWPGLSLRIRWSSAAANTMACYLSLSSSEQQAG